MNESVKKDNSKVMNKEINRIKKGFLKQLNDYKKYIRTCELDAPIEVLCLPTAILTILRNNGFSRVIEIVGLDFTKIKGLGDTRILYIQSRISQFIGM